MATDNRFPDQWPSPLALQVFEARRRRVIRRQLRKAGHIEAASLPTLAQLRRARKEA